MSDPIQQQLIIARKNQILDAAAVMFAEKGFHQTTTRDIAKQAGISEGTIYNYFDSKTTLLLGIFERMKAAVQPDDDPTVADIDLRSFIKMFLAHPLTALREDNFALFRVVTSEMLINDELRTLYVEHILEPTLKLGEAYLQAHMQKQGKDLVNARLTIRIISGMVQGLIIQNILGDPVLEAQWDELPDFLTDLLLEGLAGDS